MAETVNLDVTTVEETVSVTTTDGGTVEVAVQAEKGDAATVTVGTTTTGNAGTNASVTNSGTTSAAVFNFTIPRGDTGAAGPNSVTSATTSDGTADLFLLTASVSNGSLSITINGEGLTAAELVDGKKTEFLFQSPNVDAVISIPNQSGTLALTSDIPTLGTGVATALAVNIGSAGAFVVNGGALGTPSSGTLSSCTGLPISTGVSGLGANVATFLATPSSANLAAAVTDETGTGSLVFANAPTFTGGLQFSSSAVAVATMENLGTRRVTRATLATRTSGSLVADDTLVLPVVSGVTYRIVVHTLTKNSTATVGMVARLDHPTITATGSEVVGHLTNSGGNATVTPSSSTALTNMVNQNGQNLSTRMEVILTPTASGDVKVMWGARVPAGVETAGLNAGSYLEITQLI